MNKYHVDMDFLRDPKNEEIDALRYYENASCFLANYLLADSNLCSSKLCAHIDSVLHDWQFLPEGRIQRGDFFELLVAGAVGKALYFLEMPAAKGQMRKELLRLANDVEQFIGNYYLFSLVGLLASKGNNVEFVEERNTKTPDLRITNAFGYYYIEANARQPHWVISDNTQKRQQIKALIEEKRPKFNNPCFRPGIIAGEVTLITSIYDSEGTQSSIKLLRDTQETLSPGITLYYLDRDPGWQEIEANINSMLRHVVEEYSLQDNKDYVAGIYLSIVRQVYISGTSYYAPRGALLLVDSKETAEKCSALNNVIYVVNKESVRKQFAS